MQLTRREGDKKASYGLRHAQYLAQRSIMMQAWVD